VLLFWLPLGFMLAALLSGTVFAVVRGLRAWRGLKATGGRLGGALDEVSASTGEIETQLERAAAGSERLTAALDRLARARARLDVQRAALREARDTVARAVPFVSPR
jgi:hypothetical protein